MSIKGSRNRLQPNEFAAWDNSQLWANIDAKKLENKIKDKAIKIDSISVREIVDTKIGLGPELINNGDFESWGEDKAIKITCKDGCNFVCASDSTGHCLSCGNTVTDFWAECDRTPHPVSEAIKRDKASQITAADLRGYKNK